MVAAEQPAWKHLSRHPFPTIAGLGELHRGRKSIQPAGRLIRGFYDAAREALKHPLLELTALEIAPVGKSFGDVVRQRNYTCYECAIMPDHIHLLIRKHRDQAEAMIAHFQEASRKAVLAKSQAGRDGEHPVWGGPGWKVFLTTAEDMARVAKYIRDNPRKAGRPSSIGRSWRSTTDGCRAKSVLSRGRNRKRRADRRVRFRDSQADFPDAAA